MLRFVIIATVAMFAASACGVADDSSTPDPPPGGGSEFSDSVSPEIGATRDQRRAPARQQTPQLSLL